MQKCEFTIKKIYDQEVNYRKKLWLEWDLAITTVQLSSEFLELQEKEKNKKFLTVDQNFVS